MLKKYFDNFGLLVGIIGLVIFMFGLTEHNINNKNAIVLSATTLLFISAIVQKEPFFRGLQCIAFISASMVFFNTPQSINLSIFALLSLAFATFYFRNTKIDIINICAFIGLVSLCLGILLVNNYFMMLCGIFLSIYAIFSIRKGFSVGWVFLVLNILFALIAANTLYNFI
jgi:hypothetical protein